MKKYVLLTALAMTASMYADGDIVAQMKSDKKMDQKMMDNNMSSSSMVTLASARPESDNGWYLFADALYWHADVGGTEYARKVNSTAAATSTTPAVRSGDVHVLDFKWSWGFRVGLGVNMDHDKWDSNFYYTWFRTQNSNSAAISDSTTQTLINQVSVMQESSGNGAIANSGKVRWKINFNMFDWELGRWYYVSKQLALRPHVGVKGGWINQDVDYTFSRTIAGTQLIGPTVVNNYADYDNNFWGVGPSGGVNMLWVLGNAGVRNDHRFTLFGDFAGALLYGHFDVDHKETSYSTTAGVSTTYINHPTDLDRNLAVPVLQTQLGFSWDTAFNNNKNHFMMKVGYEFQYWFRQYQQVLPQYNGSVYAGYKRVSEDLSLQGLTIDFRFDF